jgi:hypothetical protein
MSPKQVAVGSADDGRPLARVALLVTLAGWVNRQQQEMIEYLVENRVLRKQLRGRRVRLTDDQRHRLAARANGSVAGSYGEWRRS